MNLSQSASLGPGTLNKCLEIFLANQFEKHFKETHEIPSEDKHIIENIISEDPDLVIKPEFVEIYSNENDDISCPPPPQIIINQAWSVNGVPSHFICIKNVKVTKDAIIIDVFCDIEKNEDADACVLSPNIDLLRASTTAAWLKRTSTLAGACARKRRRERQESI